MSKITSKDGTVIAYDKVGAGSTVVLIGGATVFRATDPNTTELARLLATHFTVITYDRRGRGESEDAPIYAVEREIEDIEALINEAGGSAYACGFSSGGALALWAASKLGADKIIKVVAYEPPFAVGDRPKLPKDYVEKINTAVAENRRGDALELFMTVAVGMPPETVKPMRDEPWWGMLEPIAHTLAYDGMIMGDGSLPTERLASVTVPALVMAGTAGEKWFRDAAQAAAEALPRAKYLTLKDQTHAVDPKVLAPELEEFFKSN